MAYTLTQGEKGYDDDDEGQRIEFNSKAVMSNMHSKQW